MQKHSVYFQAKAEVEGMNKLRKHNLELLKNILPEHVAMYYMDGNHHDVRIKKLAS